MARPLFFFQESGVELWYMEEIEMLKKRIAELEATSAKERPEIIKEALKEHIEKPPEQVLAESQRMAPEEIKKQAERILGLKTEEEPHQRQVLELLQLFQEKGILNDKGEGFLATRIVT
jgi:predicted nuclease with TOPRIM domain